MNELARRPVIVQGSWFHSSLDERPNPESPLLDVDGPWAWTPTSRDEIAYSVRWHSTPWWRRWSRWR